MKKFSLSKPKPKSGKTDIKVVRARQNYLKEIFNKII